MGKRRLEELEARVAALEEWVESFVPPEAPIQYVQEIKRPPPFSTPIQFGEMNQEHSNLLSYYSEEGDEWGYGVYI